MADAQREQQGEQAAIDDLMEQMILFGKRQELGFAHEANHRRWTYWEKSSGVPDPEKDYPLARVPNEALEWPQPDPAYQAEQHPLTASLPPLSSRFVLSTLSRPHLDAYLAFYKLDRTGHDEKDRERLLRELCGM